MSNSFRLSFLITALCLAGAPNAAAHIAPTHPVSPGETLSGIAVSHGVSLHALAAANGLTVTSFVIAGRTLTIPGRGQASVAGPPAPVSGYRVRLNDTLSGVALEHGVSISQLAAANGLSPSAKLIAGTSLRLPAKTATPTRPSAATQTGATRLVRPGDTLSGIAASNGLATSVLAAANGLSAEHHVIAGTTLRMPAAAAATAVVGPVGAPGRLTAPQIGAIAAQYGVPASLAIAIAWQESGFNNAMVSVAGARGIMQVMPTTWTYIQNELGAGPLNPNSPTDNVRAGCILLRQLLRESGGDQRIAIAAYYQGMSSVRRIGMLPETRTYVASVMALRSRFGG